MGVISDCISWENLIYVADFLQASGERKFPILGGEPTLHPDFNNILRFLLARDFEINVFTSGIMPEAKLEETEALVRDFPIERMSFVCNLNDPVQTPGAPGEQERVQRFLRTFGERVVPGFNIYRTDFDLEFLFQDICDFGLRRTIRLGIAHPTVGGSSRSIALGDIDTVIHRLFTFAPLFERLRIKPGFDCGFPLCRFSDEQLGWLYRETGNRYDFGCNAVMDIGPDLSVWACFPLSSFHKKSLYEFDTMRDLREYFLKFHRDVRIEAGGIYEECDPCLHREEHRCAGGCLAHNLARFQSEARIRMKEIYE